MSFGWCMIVIYVESAGLMGCSVKVYFGAVMGNKKVTKCVGYDMGNMLEVALGMCDCI